MSTFNDNWNYVNNIFGISQGSSQYQKLKSEFNYTDSCWYSETLGNNLEIVKYLLICEAPPESATFPPDYLYNVNSNQFKLLDRIWKAFFPDQPQPSDIKTIYQLFAKEGLLIVDSLQYACEYESKKRKSSDYKYLIKDSIYWWKTKIEIYFDIDPELKVAFGWKLNGQAIMKALPNSELVLNGVKVKLDDKNIAADSSYLLPNPSKLRDIFDL